MKIVVITILILLTMALIVKLMSRKKNQTESKNSESPKIQSLNNYDGLIGLMQESKNEHIDSKIEDNDNIEKASNEEVDSHDEHEHIEHHNDHNTEDNKSNDNEKFDAEKAMIYNSILKKKH